MYFCQHNLGARYIEADDPRGVELMTLIAEQTEDVGLELSALRYISRHALLQGDTPEKTVESLLRAIETAQQELEKERGDDLAEKVHENNLEHNLNEAKRDLEAVGDLNMTVEVVGVSDDSLNGKEGTRACQTNRCAPLC